MKRSAILIVVSVALLLPISSVGGLDDSRIPRNPFPDAWHVEDVVTSDQPVPSVAPIEKRCCQMICHRCDIPGRVVTHTVIYEDEDRSQSLTRGDKIVSCITAGYSLH